MSNEPSPETHVFVGIFRPEINALIKDLNVKYNTWLLDQTKPRPLDCPVCRRDLMGDYQRSQLEYTKLCWDAGHFDVPVYKTIEEVVRMQRPVEVSKAPEPTTKPRTTMWPEENDIKPPK